jgi:hypothetical protein
VNGEDADFDIGCIHLDEPLGLQVGWFAVAALPSERLESFLVNVSGYPEDRGGGAEQYLGRNRVLEVSERRLFYEVDTYGGQSGAPGLDSLGLRRSPTGGRHPRLRHRWDPAGHGHHGQFGASDHPRGPRPADRAGQAGRRLASGVTPTMPVGQIEWDSAERMATADQIE